jgi:hypothetical protein
MTEQKYVCSYRAKFRNLKVPVGSTIEVVHCELVMELRRFHGRPHLFRIHYATNGKPVSMRLYTLLNAKEACRNLFKEQLSEWVPFVPAYDFTLIKTAPPSGTAS